MEDVLRVGDTLIITELDRLGRNKQEILKQLRFLEEKGVRVMVLELPTTLFDLSQMEEKGEATKGRYGGKKASG